MSAKFKNMSFTTSASGIILFNNIILMVILLDLSVSVFATPFNREREWSAMVVPITWSPVTSYLGRITTQSKTSRWWNSIATSTHIRPAKTMAEASYLYSTCRDFSCHDMNCDMNRIVDIPKENNRLGQNHQETKRRGNNHHHKKKQCSDKNQQNKSCDKNQHQKHCGKNRCEKRCGKNQGKKLRGEKRNGQSRHDTTNSNQQNNIKNGNKRRQLVVDNKVRYGIVYNIINFSAHLVKFISGRA